MSLTKAMQQAAKWLLDRGGDGMFDANGIALAGGETAPVMRGTWNTLAKMGIVEFYNPTDKGRGRLRLTEHGRKYATSLDGVKHDYQLDEHGAYAPTED